jgi:cyclophilin family peptidyl-prolyl cis-trans isomerase
VIQSVTTGVFDGTPLEMPPINEPFDETFELNLVLFPEAAPVAVESFIDLAESGYYEGRIFHRIIHNFMIQGGSLNGDGMGDPNFDGFDTEVSEHTEHSFGAMSTANSGLPGSNGQQFFIVSNPDGTAWLDGNHTVFGHLVDGFDGFEVIANLETFPGDRPVMNVIIQSVEITVGAGENKTRGNVGGSVAIQDGDTYATIRVRVTNQA